jgi:hypothetical protein
MPDLQKIAAESALERGLRCSFCSRGPHEGSDLIVGPGVCICDECIAASSDMLTAENGDGDWESLDPGDDEPDGSEPGVNQPKVDESNRDDLSGDGQTVIVAKPKRFRLLSDADVAGLLTMDDIIGAMPDVLRRFSSSGTVQQSERSCPLAAIESSLPSCLPVFVTRLSWAQSW